MAGITDEQRLVNALKTFPVQKARVPQLASSMRDLYGEKWTDEAVDAKARQLSAKPASPIFVVRGGVQYFGVENLRDCALYKAVGNGVHRWGAERGLRSIVAEPLGRPSRGQVAGDWTYPDMVLRVTRRADAKQTLHLHSLEIEQALGFSIASIYQSYEQGRGADFAWVFYVQTTKGAPDSRILDAAADLGVGVVGMPRPTHPSGWITHRTARLRPTTKRARTDFERRIGVQ